MSRDLWWSAAGATLAAALGVLLVLPLVALVTSVTPASMLAAMGHPQFLPALGLSLRTTAVSTLTCTLLGAPLAWWLARSSTRLARTAAVIVHLPMVVPPAVVGVGLLQTFGRRGLLGPWLDDLGITVAFTEPAVVLAQVVVSAPLFVHSARAAFRRVDEDTLIVARTLGASASSAFWRVAVPTALPGLLAGVSLCWARALGEFGATLLFAGNLPGRTQTLPLAIFTALEADVQLAVVFSLALVALGALLLGALRLAGGHGS